MTTLNATNVHTYTQSDGYVTHYRLWGAASGDEVVVLLHGGMSHSEWQVPIAEAIRSKSDISFIATDRRGHGLNMQERGHLDSHERVVNDVVEFLQSLHESFTRVHLAGWCFGGLVATAAAAQVIDGGVISSLILIAPSFSFTERYGDVLWLSVQSARQAIAEFNLTPEPTKAYIQMPLQPRDFTLRPDWQRFIANDPLRLTKVTDGAVRVWGEIARRAEKAFSQVDSVPVLVVLGTEDRLVDVERTRKFVTSHRFPVVEDITAGHAVQFEQPDKLAEMVLSFLSTT